MLGCPLVDHCNRMLEIVHEDMSGLACQRGLHPGTVAGPADLRGHLRVHRVD
jgi:hypothetical protein